MTFTYRPAVRDKVALLIAIAGASGSGKTLSSLKVARGLAGGRDDAIAVIDTEAGRAKHYAPAPGEKPGPERFAFRHGDLHPPFTPEAYIAAIDAAEEAGAEVIVIDSFSHEWEGEGGLHDIHDTDLAAAVDKARQSHNANWGPFDEAKAAERLNIGAWRDPKQRHKRLVSRLLQCRAHLVICLRADEKVRIVKDEKNRTKIVQAADLPPKERWTPICEKRFMYEMTVSLIVTPQEPGVPVPVKVQEQHRPAIEATPRLSEDTGRRLAEWAGGGFSSAPLPPGADRGAGVAPSPPSGGDPGPTFDEWKANVEAVLREDENPAALRSWWEGEAQADLRRSFGERALPLHRQVNARIKELERETA